ncbi:RHS repeat domain-containing protein [Luedemannella flava]
MGNEWKSTYDLLGRLSEAKDPDKGTTKYGYDNAGRLTSVTDSNNEAALRARRARPEEVGLRGLAQRHAARPVGL